MKRVIITFLFTLFTVASYAQAKQIIKGYVYSSDGEALEGAVIKATGENTIAKSAKDGSFEIDVARHCNYIEASLEGYISAQAELNGSTVLFRLKVDKKYTQMKAKEEAAKAEAERKAQEQARIEAEKAHIAAEKEAAAKAEAEHKAQEQARIEAEKARLAAEKEAAAKAEAEREAQEQARIAKEKAEKARLAKIAAEKRQKLYAEQQSGFASIADLSYMVGVGGVHSGIGINYIAGYRINNLLYVGGGTGVNLNFGAGSSWRGIAERYSGTKFLNPCLASVPLFAYFKVNFLNRRCSPFFALAAGGNFSGKQILHLDLCDVKYSNTGLFANTQLGVNYRTTTKTAVYFAVGFQAISAPACIRWTGYNATFQKSFGCGIDFHIGFTF